MRLEDIYTLVSHNEDDQAVDLLFTLVDELLLSGQFERCDEFLAQIDPTRLSKS